jgi:hypothetical protein
MNVPATPLQIAALLDLIGRDTQAAMGGAEACAPPPRRVAEQGTIPAAILERYEALAARGRVPVVVAVKAGYCSGCRLRLPAALDQQIRISPGIYTCPHCQRMLYAPGHLGRSAEDPLSAADGATVVS